VPFLERKGTPKELYWGVLLKRYSPVLFSELFFLRRFFFSTEKKKRQKNNQTPKTHPPA
jgi:hypothetical protein